MAPRRKEEEKKKKQKISWFSLLSFSSLRLGAFAPLREVLLFLFRDLHHRHTMRRNFDGVLAIHLSQIRVLPQIAYFVRSLDADVAPLRRDLGRRIATIEQPHRV